MLSTRAFIGAAALFAASILVTFMPSAAATPPTIFEDDFESGSVGWTGTGLWNVSTRVAKSPTHSWHYGIELPDGNSTYDTGYANAGNLTSPIIDLSNVSFARASFWSRWAGEGTCTWEHPRLFVQNASGARVLAWEDCRASGNGTFIANLTPFVGQPIRLVFSWDTRDAAANGFEGWYVDDVRVTNEHAPPPPPPSVDLVVTNASTSPSPIPSANMTLRGTIVNAGTANATGGFGVLFRIDGANVSSLWFPSGMPAGYVLNVSTNVTAPPAGNHTFELVADHTGNVTETNESNNSMVISFETMAMTWNLYAKDVVVHGQPHAGESIDVSVRVGNTGPTQAPNATITWRIDGSVVKVQPIGALPGGVAFNASATLPGTGVGVHHVSATVSAPGEANTTDNNASKSFVVLGNPLVSIDIPDMHPVMLRTEAGEFRHPLGRHEATLRHCNHGNVGSGNGTVHLSVRGGAGNNTTGTGIAQLSSRVVPPLAGGSCREDVFRFDTPGIVGDFTLTATLVVPHDATLFDNWANATGFRVVADHGGVALPGGATQATVDPVHAARNASDPALANGVTLSQALLANATRVAGETLAAIEDQWSALLQNVNASASLTAANATVCGAGLVDAACEQYHGDYGTGTLRACRLVTPTTIHTAIYDAFHPDHLRESWRWSPVGPVLDTLPRTGIDLCHPTPQELAMAAARLADDAMR